MASQELPQQPWWMESNSYSNIHSACLTWSQQTQWGEQDHVSLWPRVGLSRLSQTTELIKYSETQGGSKEGLQDVEIEGAERMTESYREVIKLAPLIQALCATKWMEPFRRPRLFPL